MYTVHVKIIQINYKSGVSVTVPLHGIEANKYVWRYLQLDNEEFKDLRHKCTIEMVRAIVMLGSTDIESLYLVREILLNVSDERYEVIKKYNEG